MPFLTARLLQSLLQSLRRIAVVPALALVLLPAACGYHFAGMGKLPGDIRNLSVVMLKNRTSETSLENVITNDLIYELSRSGQVHIVDADQAEATLSGVITAVTTETISHRGEHTSNERRVTVRVDLRLMARNGEVLWERKGLRDKEAYNVLDGKLETEQNRKQAIQTLSTRLSETVYTSLTDDF